MEILILHPGGLGDIILSLPAIALIRSQYPSARITIAGNLDHLAAIVSNYAEKVVSLSNLPLHRLYTHEPIPETDVRFWKSYDRIVSWTGSGDPAFAANFHRIHPNVCVTRWQPKPDEARHVSQLFVDSLDFNVPSGREVIPARLHLDSKLREEGKEWLIARGWNAPDPLIALHPGAGSESKRWPLARFVDLARLLALQEKKRLLIIEGPAERNLAQQMVRALPEIALIRAESIPLNLLAAVFLQCHGFVGNDSGIAHLSAALNVPSVVLFGPTQPRHWAPLGSNVIILRNTHGCEACASRGSEHICLANISLEEVIGKIISNVVSRRRESEQYSS